ncbi:hypothetical protein AB0I75_13540 [Streptomyces sp. NPDC050273]|uniref:hypothetical protein n=1 Tax=Streptomyces sp. NPDC050273 TaxID=3154933 RepID=UPI003434FE01
MTDRTNDAIYDKVESVGSDVKSLKTYVTEGHPSKTVTTTHFDTKVGELKKAIEGGPKTNPKSFKDSLIEFFGAKSLVDSFKESGLAQLVLATGATVALLSTLGIKLLDTEKAVKALTRGLTGGREFSTNDRGRIQLAVPQDPAGTAPGTTPVNNLPQVAQLNAAKEAAERLDTAVRSLNTGTRNLMSPRLMNQSSTAADRLAGSLSSLTSRVRPSDLDSLSQATGRLTHSMRDFDPSKLPSPQRMRQAASAADRLGHSMQGLGGRIRELSQAASGAA